MRNKNLLLIIVAFLLLVIPLTVYLALTKQFIFKKAAFGEVTINLYPSIVTLAPGQQFNVDVYLNSGTLPVSAATLRLTMASNLELIQVLPETGTAKPFTDFIDLPDTNSEIAFTLLAKKAASQLPSGNFKAATVVLKAKTPSASGNINILPSTSEIVGYNQNNEDVAFTIRQGSNVAFSITGNLCKLSACPANVSLSETVRTDGKYNINVVWTAVSGTNVIYKVYRNKDNPVPTNNPDANLVGTINSNSFADTNNNNGFNGLEKYYYNVDAFQICQ